MKVKNIMFSGFAAAILMGTVDANAALSIASKDYVDTQVGALSGNGGAITSLQTRMTTAEGTLNTLTGDGAGSVAKAEADAKSYADTKAGAAETAAKTYAKDYADGLASNYATAEQGAKADAALPATTAAATYQTLANKVTDLSGTFENDTQYPSAKAVKAALAATGGDVSGVSSRVTTLENAVNNQTTGLAATYGIATANQSAIQTLNGDDQTTGSVAKAIADEVTRADGAYQAKALVTTLTNADDTHYPSAKAVSDALADYTTTTGMNTALDLKANSADVYTTSQTYTKTEVDNLLNAKQGSLTEDQLAAADSGITTAKRTSYDTVVNTMNGECSSESDYCALVKGPTGAITWVEITNPFTAGTSGNNNNDNPNG